MQRHITIVLIILFCFAHTGFAQKSSAESAEQKDKIIKATGYILTFAFAAALCSKWFFHKPATNDFLPAYKARLLQSCYVMNEEQRRRAALLSTKQACNDYLHKFWREKDQIPETEELELMQEYYRRVDIANKKFKEAKDGWKTDCGRTLILYGEPAYILYEDWTKLPLQPPNRHGALDEQITAKKVQIWVYDAPHVYTPPSVFDDFVLLSGRAFVFFADFAANGCYKQIFSNLAGDEYIDARSRKYSRY